MPLTSVLEIFFEKYNVNTKDLWPVDNSEVSLNKIRNHLIHGRYLNKFQFEALTYTYEHLKWLVERMLLAILKWPVKESTVSEEYLSKNLYAYNNWKVFYKDFFKIT